LNENTILNKRRYCKPKPDHLTKLVRNIGVWGIGTGLGAILAGPIGAATGFGLGLLDTFLLESILKGKNPSMFIESIRRERENNQAGEV
jgi:hypothetical protein